MLWVKQDVFLKESPFLRSPIFSNLSSVLFCVIHCISSKSHLDNSSTVKIWSFLAVVGLNHSMVVSVRLSAAAYFQEPSHAAAIQRYCTNELIKWNWNCTLCNPNKGKVELLVSSEYVSKIVVWTARKVSAQSPFRLKRRSRIEASPAEGILKTEFSLSWVPPLLPFPSTQGDLPESFLQSEI